MSASIRTFLALLVLLPVTFLLAVQIGEGEYVMPLAALVLAGGWLATQVFGLKAPYDGAILAFLIFGYIVGSRGFAQLTPSYQYPLFVGEIGMVACIGIFAFRNVHERSRLLPKHPLTLPILAFLIYGGLRLLMDVRVFHLDAVRDSALVYYAVFFFIAYHIAKNKDSRRLLEVSLIWAVFWIIPCYLLQVYKPEIFDRLAVRGVPLIIYKGDLVGIFFAVGVITFFLASKTGTWKKLCLALCLISMLLLVFNRMRAPYVALIVGVALLYPAKQRALIGYMIASVVLVVLVGLSLLALPEMEMSKDNALSHVYKDALSIVDWKGDMGYEAESEHAGNNAFRVVWWKNIIEETSQKAPVFGLGFGYNLADRFLLDYFGGGVKSEDYTVRSPHSCIVAVYGRMGFVGLAIFSVIVFQLFRGAYRKARAVASGQKDIAGLGHWISAVVIFVGACFGVVLEGPMGGIVFWSLLGMACAYDSDAVAETTINAVAGIQYMAPSAKLPQRESVGAARMPATRFRPSLHV